MSDSFTLIKMLILKRLKNEDKTYPKLENFVGELYHHKTKRSYILEVELNKERELNDTLYKISLCKARHKAIESRYLGSGRYTTIGTMVFDDIELPVSISKYKYQLLGDIEEFIQDILI